MIPVDTNGESGSGELEAAVSALEQRVNDLEAIERVKAHVVSSGTFRFDDGFVSDSLCFVFFLEKNTRAASLSPHVFSLSCIHFSTHNLL